MKYLTYLLTKFILILTTIGITACIKRYQTTTILHQDLLRNYSKFIRPRYNQDDSVDVSLMYIPNSMIKFDEVNGVLSLITVIQLQWHDEMMTWNASSYDGITQIYVPTEKVWMPSLYVGNGADKLKLTQGESVPKYVMFNSSGRAAAALPSILSTLCQPTIKYFPKDHHTCNIDITAFEPKSRVVLNSNLVLRDMAVENPLWEILSVNITNKDKFQYSNVEVRISLARRSTFLFLTLVLPVTIISFVNLLVFVIPPESGERVSFSVTVLLTLSVFITIMSDNIPKTSFPIAVFAVSLIIKLIVSSLIVVVTVLLLVVHHSPSNKMAVVSFCKKLITNSRRKVQNVKTSVKKIPKNKTDIAMSQCGVDVITNHETINSGATDTDLNADTASGQSTKHLDCACLVFFAVLLVTECFITGGILAGDSEQ